MLSSYVVTSMLNWKLHHYTGKSIISSLIRERKLLEIQTIQMELMEDLGQKRVRWCRTRKKGT